MTVEQLIILLTQQNPDNEVLFWEKFEGDNFDINQVSDDNGETILNT